MKTLKLSTPPGAPPHVADIVNQLNRIVPELQKAIEANQTAAAAQIAQINARLGQLSPAALTALINSVTNG